MFDSFELSALFSGHVVECGELDDRDEDDDLDLELVDEADDDEDDGKDEISWDLLLGVLFVSFDVVDSSFSFVSRLLLFADRDV